MSMEILVCPSCLALNRVQKEQIIDHPKCDECKTALLPDSPIDADTMLFNRLKEHSTLPVVADFWGAWSGSSHEMAPVFANLSKSFKGDALFIKVNSEREQVLAGQLKLCAIPTFILFKEGKEYHRLTGNQLETRFHGWLERYLRVKRKVGPSRHDSV